MQLKDNIHKEAMDMCYHVDNTVCTKPYFTVSGIEFKKIPLIELKVEQLRLLGRVLSKRGHNLVLAVNKEATVCYVPKKYLKTQIDSNKILSTERNTKVLVYRKRNKLKFNDSI